MCEPVSATIAGTAIASAVIGGTTTAIISERAARKQTREMNRETEASNERTAEAQKALDLLGPAAKSLDLAKDESAYRDLKRNKIAMQSGILGTMKTSPLGSQDFGATQKATLGS